VPTKKALESLIALQSTVLEMIAYGEPISNIAEQICREAEALSGDAHCMIIGVSSDGHVAPLAAPNLTSAFLRQFREQGHRLPALVDEVVSVLDIGTDPRWSPSLRATLPSPLRAYWSSPIRARDGRLIGKFSFYYTTSRSASEGEQAVVTGLTRLCSILIEHAENQRKVQDLAFTDLLSNLPNRASYNERLCGLMKEANSPFALLLVDVDHLKAVNDTMGHATGDALIRTVAARLKRIGGTVEPFRLGGDEFGLIVHGCDSEDAMDRVAQGIINEASTPFETNGHCVMPSVTIGGAIYDPSVEGHEQLSENADLALYHGKELRRGSFVPFRSGMQTSIAQRVQAMDDLGAALSERRIEAYYQPIVRIDTGVIVGMEALARMKARDGRIIPAAEFYRATSDPRLAYDLTGQMLKQVTHALRDWLAMGIPFQHIGFNVTQADFKQGDLEGRLVDAFSEAGIPLKHIILEVNEAVYLGPGDDFVAKCVERLRAKGILVALDDFGTGFASLTHLLHFPVDIIKIDRSFITDITTDRNSCVIVEALVGIAAKLGMRIVAEGIETIEQAEKLLSLGCKLGQGYRFAPPVPRGMATELLQRLAEGVQHSSAHCANKKKALQQA